MVYASHFITMQAVLAGVSTNLADALAASSLPGAPSYVAPAGFPTSAFSYVSIVQTQYRFEEKYSQLLI